MQITFIIHSLTSGGAERVLSIMANYWAAKDWQVTILTFDEGSQPPFYQLDKRIKHQALNLSSASKNAGVALLSNWSRIKQLKTAIISTNPDIVISFMPKVSVLTLLAISKLNIPVLVSEHHYPIKGHLNQPWHLLRILIYPRASKVIHLTQRACDCFPAQIQKISQVIPNPIIINHWLQSETQLLSKPALIAMGRLSEQKGFDLLIKAFAKIALKFPQWNLTILGEGKLRSELEALRDQLGLTQRIHLPGRVKNPYEFLQQADIFVMSSRHEGFPMALCEAMACGLPVISTNCPSGPAEIIRNGVDGILIPEQDISALSRTMEFLMNDETERKRLSVHSPEVTERFGLEKVMSLWESLINKTVQGQNTANQQLLHIKEN